MGVLEYLNQSVVFVTSVSTIVAILAACLESKVRWKTRVHAAN